jgi:hypothetical protein
MLFRQNQRAPAALFLSESELRRLAGKAKGADQARRLLARAAIADGMKRRQAAPAEGPAL